MRSLRGVLPWMSREDITIRKIPPRFGLRCSLDFSRSFVCFLLQCDIFTCISPKHLVSSLQAEVSEKVTVEILKSVRKITSLFSALHYPSQSSLSLLLSSLSLLSPLLSPLLSHSHISVQKHALLLSAVLFRDRIVSDSHTPSGLHEKKFLSLVEDLSLSHQTVDARMAAAKAISLSGYLPIKSTGKESSLLIAMVGIRLLSDDDEDVRMRVAHTLSLDIPIKVKGVSEHKTSYTAARQPVVPSLILDSLWSHVVDTSENDPNFAIYLERLLFQAGFTFHIFFHFLIFSISSDFR